MSRLVTVVFGDIINEKVSCVLLLSRDCMLSHIPFPDISDAYSF